MQQTTLNRLLAAKHIIQSSGPVTTKSASAISVAQKLLAAHDASELVFLALIAHSCTQVTSPGGQIVKDPSFYLMANAVIQLASANDAFQQNGQLNLFQDLLDARKLFKHAGMLVDADSNAHLFDHVVTALDDICLAVTGVALLDYTESDAIQDVEIREDFRSARSYLDSQDYRMALEATALALTECFMRMNTPAHIAVGTVSTEDALLLSGRGVDPAAYILMQKLLPTTVPGRRTCEWDQRKFGHPGNWTESKARFCLRTALDVASKLQTASPQPQADDFYEFYEDVVEIVNLETEAVLIKSHWFSSDFQEENITVFQLGDRIYGKAVGMLEKTGSLPNEDRIDYEYAEWIAIQGAYTERIQIPHDIPRNNVLWLRQSSVQIGHRVNFVKAKWMENPEWNYDDLRDWKATVDETLARSDLDERYMRPYDHSE